MAIPYVDINNIISRWAANDPPVIDFTVNNVLAATGLTHDSYIEVFRYLMSKQGFELSASKMLLCPNNHKGPVFSLSEKVDENDIFDCYCCDELYHYDEKHTMIVFNFTENFKEEAKKKLIQIA